MTLPTSLDADPGQRPRPARRLAQVAAGVLLLFAVLGLVGEISGVDLFVAPVSQWPRLNILSSVALLALAVGFYGFLARARTTTLVGSGLTFIIGLASLAGTAGMIRLPDEGMALASAVMLTTAAMGLFLSTVLGDHREEVCLGIAGSVMLMVTITFLVARYAHVVDPFTDRVVAGVSLQVITGSLLLGFTFLRMVWSRGLAESARWLPLAVGLASFVTVLVLWRALSVRETDQVLSQTHQAAVAKRAALLRDLGVAARSLSRAADWRMAGASLDQQARDLQALQSDLPGMEGGLWLDVHPLPARQGVRTFAGISPDSVWRTYLLTAGKLVDSNAYLPMDDGTRRFLILAPGCEAGGNCAGAMGGVMGSAGFFESAFADTTTGFRFAMESGRRPFDGSPRPALDELSWSQSLPVEMGGLRMSLTAWPMPSTLTRLHSNLPGLVLLMGVLGSGLLPLTIRLGQTARQRARDSERVRLASALERSTDGIWEWDLVTGHAQRSPGLWRHLGYDPQTVSWEHAAWLSLIHPEDRSGVEEALRRHLAGESTSFEAEYRIRSRGDVWHTILDRGRVVERSTGGQATRMLGISADVTETRSAEAERDATERRFRAIFDSGFQFQLLLDRNGQVIEANQVALAERGASLDVVRHKPVWETLWWVADPQAAERIRQAAASALAGGMPHYEEEVRGPGGGQTILEIAVKPILDASGEPAQLLLEARDITARRRAEAALQEVDTLTTMGRVAARVAHEINNPLAGIQNSFLLIKGAVPTTHPHYAYVGAIEREITRIAAVTRQLYETYRPEHDGTGETSLRTVLGDAIAFLEQVNRSSGVKVETEYLNIPSVIPLPAAMLRQIAYNLIQNAIEVCPPGTVIQVRAAVMDRELEIRVIDCGPGVPEDLRERIFEPFFSTKDHRSRTGGMGLGLALVRRTVTAAGGTIRVGDAEGGGSEFVVSLPLHTPDRGV